MCVLGNDLELVKVWDPRAAIPSVQGGEPDDVVRLGRVGHAQSPPRKGGVRFCELREIDGVKKWERDIRRTFGSRKPNFNVTGENGGR